MLIIKEGEVQSSIVNELLTHVYTFEEPWLGSHQLGQQGGPDLFRCMMRVRSVQGILGGDSLEIVFSSNRYEILLVLPFLEY